MDEENRLLDNEIIVSMSNATYKGEVGPQGPQGEPGFSAYVVAVDNGFVGTEREWLASLVGPQGPEGPKGDTPVKGVDYFTQQDVADVLAQVPGVDLTTYATKAEVELAIRGAETGLLKRSVVQSLPQSDIDDNTIYMVPKAGSSGDVYNEYLYIENAWEHIGSTDVDLTDYATLTYVNSGLQGKQATLIPGNGIVMSGATISSNIEYLDNNDILAIWNNGSNL